MGIPLFGGLTFDEICRFIDKTGTIFKKYDVGTRILKSYNPNSKIGVMVSGEAQIVSEDIMGNEIIGHRLQRGSLIGITSAILALDNNPTSVETLSDVEILWIPYQALIGVGVTLGRIHGIVMKNFLESLCQRNLMMMQKIELLSQKSLRDRIILYIMQREKQQNTINVQVPGRVQMSKELECNRSALTREIGRMESDGLIVCKNNRIQLNKDRIK